MNDPHSYPHRGKKTVSLDQLVMGVNTVQELLRHASNRILMVYTAVSPSTQKRKNELLEMCIKKRIPIQYVSFEALTKMAGSDSHQSFLAHVKSRKTYEIEDFLCDQEESFILMIDQIFDPQNFGAILRSAECFGVDAVVWSKNRGCDLTPLVTKASCGASELLPLLRVSNLADAVEKFKRAGYEIIAALADSEARSIYNERPTPKTVLIMGSEGEGIQPLLRKKADRKIYIPLSGKIESLNVAQATAVLLSWHSQKN